ncbi:MAG: hypothetical protein JSS66_12860 [Armatimonadetes bacterium]|nr:hypothetical protein [Armatimonadota bacterium]
MPVERNAPGTIAIVGGMRLPLLASIVLLPGVIFAQDKATYTWPVVKPVEGQLIKMQLDVAFQAMGQDASVTGVVSRKVTKVESNGDFEVESGVEGVKVKLMNDVMDQESHSSTKKFHADGTPFEKRTFENGIDEVLAALTLSRFSDKPVTVGDKWVLDPKSGLPGKGTATLTGLGEKASHQCFLIAVEYECGNEGGSMKGDVAFDQKTGDVIDVSGAFKAIKIGGGIISDGTIKLALVNALRN